MKGYELYSWQDGGQWKFSLLVGTNREKTLEEIPAGQYITWSSRETLSFPPDDIVQQVEQTCKDEGLILSVAS